MPDVKQYLLSYRDKLDNINILADRIEALKDRISSVGGVSFSDMPKNPSPEVDRLSHQIAIVLDLQKELEAAQQDILNDYKSINKLIDKLEAPKEREVIKSRYLDLFKWEEINFLFFGNKEDFTDKEESYQRRIFKLHKSGLENLNNIYHRFQGRIN